MWIFLLNIGAFIGLTIVMFNNVAQLATVFNQQLTGLVAYATLLDSALIAGCYLLIHKHAEPAPTAAKPL
ncbi:hypothetical protein HY493_00675 [Candidatus Woesearchaeota archaeon]|nr:hypothetical protein [Candidatus Woesearchaeota archaeon]